MLSTLFAGRRTVTLHSCSNSRLYTEASIRILLADTQADLHPERGALGDGQDIQLGVTTVGTTTSSVNIVGTGNYMYYGVATAGTNGWVAPTNPATGTAYGWTTWPLLSQITSSPASVAGAAPNAASVWLRVEYLNNANVWVGITTQWLGYGFGRGYNTPPTAPYVVGGANPVCSLYPTPPAGQCYNPISPAILILQQLNQGVATASAVEADTSSTPVERPPTGFPSTSMTHAKASRATLTRGPPTPLPPKAQRSTLRAAQSGS